jgi:uncharacterized protein (TIGR03437 family)
MKRKSWMLITALCVWLSVASAWGASFGEAVAVGGHASDLALDETRGFLYIANFTANRIDVLSLADRRIQTSLNVAAQPASIALSPDGRYLVVAHYSNFTTEGVPEGVVPPTANNSLTVIDVETRGQQTYALESPPLGVAFGRGSQALVVTTTDFFLFDPVSGLTNRLSSISDLVATSLPVPPANFPPNILMSSMNVSGDGLMIYGMTDQFEFGYNLVTGWLRIFSYTSTPPQAPRVVSVNHDGSRYMAGWVLHGGAIWNRAIGVWGLAQLEDVEGTLEIGSHAIDDRRGVVYVQYARSGWEIGDPPVLEVRRNDNLAVLDSINLPENLAGKSVMSADGSIMYSISDSGVMILPVGSLATSSRVLTDREQILFQSNFCDRDVQIQEFTIYDAGGGQSDFSLSVNTAGVMVSPQVGMTPATISVRVDPAAFRNVSGTVEASISIASGAAINHTSDVRVLVNTPEPDQRGTIISVPGQLVDILPDSARDRFFVLRQDSNEVLVFSAHDYTQLASLPTGNTPTQLAITFDKRWLLVGHHNSQYVAVYDLETLQADTPVVSPPGHYPRSIAASGGAILVANRVAGPTHVIDRIDMATRRATELPSLGVYANDINEGTILVGSQSGASIMAAMVDGNVMLYDANADTFTISRKDSDDLEGAYAASAFGNFVIGSRFMNASLVTTDVMETGSGSPSGFAFVNDIAYRTTASQSSNPGVIQRVTPDTGFTSRSTRLSEAPRLGDETNPFTRTLAVLMNRDVIVNLTTSGFTVVPAGFDSSVPPPLIGDVVNAADYQTPVAPGGLVSIFGENLSPTNEATSQIPLPTALGDSCLTVNGIPIPVLFVSKTQVNAQLPFQTIGNTTLILRTPGGVSDNYNLTIDPHAPAVFSRGVEGSDQAHPTIVRAKNAQIVTDSNPIHREEHIIIYMTGLGVTTPPVEEGQPSPSDPPATLQTTVDLHLAGTGLPVSYAGLAPGQIGVYQINAEVPWWTPKGRDMPLVIDQGSASTTVYVRVVD